MVDSAIRRNRSEGGQAALLVILGVSLFLLGAVGLAVDGSQLYAQRQMAQSTADAAALAGILGIFDGTTTITSAHDCATTETTSPCWYAHQNGFGTTSGTGADIVHVDPSPGVPVNGQTSPTELQVTITRPVTMTLTKMVGLSLFNVKASSTAAVVNIVSPVPIIITHPTLTQSLSMNGTTGIKICGGPQRSIQVNSSDANAFAPPSSGSVDLTGAGPDDTNGNCFGGGAIPSGKGGGDFATHGGPAPPQGRVLLGNKGHYVYPASPIPDPLIGVPAPGVPTTSPPSGGQSCSVLGHCSSCPASGFSGSPPSTCQEYLPGNYSGGLSPSKDGFFDPGIYYMSGGGFTLKNITVAMCSVGTGSGQCTADTNTGSGMLIYDAGSTPTSTSTGGFAISTNVYAKLLGAGISTATPPTAPSSPYYGILFFEQRNADAQTHKLGQGNGCFDLVGTVYITNTLSIMQGSASHYQGVEYAGTPCSSTISQGEIIVSALTLKGTAQINMSLYPTALITVQQIALVQ
jgi:Flp pilus assembly protein TadG